MKVVFVFYVMVLVLPLSLMGMSAFLMFYSIPGWPLFLFVSTCLSALYFIWAVNNLAFEVDGSKN